MEAILVSSKEIIRDQCVFGSRCKDTRAKIQALDKGLPSLEAVITKADRAKDSVVEIDKAKLGNLMKCKNYNRQDLGRNPDEQTRKKIARPMDRLV